LVARDADDLRPSGKAGLVAMSTDDLVRFSQALGTTLLWSLVSIVIVAVVFEVLQRRYHLLNEVFHENSVAAGILAGSLVLGIFYTVTQIVIS
jgi:uncharacterized membrane protein YjfL (UPF0719 family)